MLKKAVLFLIMLFMLCAFAGCIKNAGNPSGFSALFLNTGKSDCFIIRMDSITLMIDTGETDDWNKIITAFDSHGVTRIDYLIITHFDKDHIGCAGSCIRNTDVDTVYAPRSSANSKEYRTLVQAMEDRGMDFSYVTENITINTQNGSVTIYAPLQDSYEDDNAYSLITDITYKDKSMLFTGDATKKRLAEFLSIAPEKEYEIIKLPHHGEYTKSLLTLLSKTNAKYGIITCTSDMSTVEDKTIACAEKYNVELLYTYNGDIEFIYDNGFVLNK